MKLIGRPILCALFIVAWPAAAPLFAGTTTNFEVIFPVIPPLKSPVSFVRELLAMTPSERRQSLSNRPPEIRNRILAKLREYQSLKPDERELRLRATEVQWYLQPLMNLPSKDREGWLARMPEEMRKLVEERLGRWDLLPVPRREALLNNEMTARYFTQLESATEEQKQQILSQISPERRAKLEAGLEHWRGLSTDQREKTMEGFNAFFELTPKEKEQALGSLSAAEQRQMEKTLSAYEKLPVEQRARCIRSFEKFAGMKLSDRQAFLKNAERWKLMSPAERQSWRELVNVAPFMPPMTPTSVVMPPLPKLPKQGFRSSSSVATNLN